MGLPKCFKHFMSCEVTLILRDFKTVTGRFLDSGDDERWGDDDECCDECCNHSGKKHNDDKIHDDKCQFVLLELTKDAESVSLLEIERQGGGGHPQINGGSGSRYITPITIELANVEFEKGTCICVNVCDIIYAGMNAEIEEEEINISSGNAGGDSAETL